MELLPILTGITSGWNDDRGSRLNSTLYHYFYLYSLVLVVASNWPKLRWTCFSALRKDHYHKDYILQGLPITSIAYYKNYLSQGFYITRITDHKKYQSQGSPITRILYLKDYLSQALPITRNINHKDRLSQELSISRITYHKHYQSQDISITRITYHKDYLTQELFITRVNHHLVLLILSICSNWSLANNDERNKDRKHSVPTTFLHTLCTD